MRKLAWCMIAAAAVLMTADTSMAQRDGDGDRPRGEQRDGDGPRGERGPRDGDRPRGERGPRDGDRPQGDRGPRDGEGRGRGPRDGQQGGRPEGRGGFGGSPLLAALDTDRDGKISAKEIEQAAAVLRKMDKNGDGNLTRDEMGPMGPPEGRGGFGGGPPGEGRGGRPGGQEGGRPGGFGPEQMVARMMQGDKNNDGKISKDEARGPMQERFGDADSNNDGFLDKTELAAVAKNFAERMREGGGRRPGGDGQGRPPRGEGGDRGGNREGGERRRPAADE